MSTTTLFQLAGWILCGAAFASIAVEVLQGLQTFWATRRQFVASQEKFRRATASYQTNVAASTGHRWDGWRKFRIKWKVPESASCSSLYLTPHDNKPLPTFQPGQYITLRLRIPGIREPVVRCYSLSDQPRPDVYRITVKRITQLNGKHGAASGYLQHVIKEGDLLDIGAPQGRFVLDPRDDRPIVLLAGGIGITPLLSMLLTSLEQTPHRRIHLFYGVRNSREHTFRSQLAELASAHDSLQLTTCYSQPLPEDQAGQDYQVQGRVDGALLHTHLPSSNYQFFVCGPGEFTTDLIEALQAWQVPASDVHYEAFGPATPTKKTSVEVPRHAEVTFSRSGRTATWSADQQHSLLDVAARAGAPIDSGCRTGNCGTCVTAIKAGRVRHTHPPGTAVSDGTCLPCIAVPDGPVELDA